MNLKEMFEREFLFESKKEDKKATKIFYKLDINLKKKKEEEIPQDQNNNQSSEPVQEIPQDQNMQAPELNTSEPVPAPEPEIPQDLSMNVSPDGETMVTPPPLSSVVTEDENDVEINDDENIIRKLEGEIVLDKEEVDDIQTIDDILSILTEKEKDGAKVLDEFTSDILQILVNPATQMQVKDKIDKESKIFTEIIYGKKEDDSVGIRIIKRKNSELVTTSMLIDNRILNSQYNKDILDKRITEYRNNEVGA